MKNCFVLILYMLSLTNLLAQDSTAPKFFLNGYVKALQTTNFDKIAHTNFSNQVVHNRLNFKWRPNNTIAFTSELRNRIFFGEQISSTPNFVNLLRNSNDYFNWQKAWVNNKEVVFVTNVERLYVDIKKDKWNARIGRQRVNWGIATTWNPNDLFNAYNFLDVDYEERPGSDAVKFQYPISDFSTLELVHSKSSNNKSISVAKYSMNKWNYDFQFIAGNYKGSATLGSGWAGSIKDAGFKGEIQYYFSNNQVADQLNMTMELDYMFKKGWYVNFGGLYNSRGLNKAVTNWNALNLNLSAKNLMPTKYSYILTARKQFTPISSVGCSIVYAPNVNLFLLMPSFSYNISEKLDADFIYQSFFMENKASIQQTASIAFLRLRYSF